MTPSATILIVEDDAHIRSGLVALLRASGYATEEAANGVEGLERFHAVRPDMVLLDVMMPRKNGYEVCREIRALGSKTPVIMLTAKDDEQDKVTGLELGADDYIVKPFGVKELLARIAAALRRAGFGGLGESETFAFGRDTVHGDRYELHRFRDGAFEITARELALLRFFAAHRGEALTRDALLNAVWGVSYFGTTRTLDQHIALLRKKLSDPAVIETLHGIGYRYR